MNKVTVQTRICLAKLPSLYIKFLKVKHYLLKNKFFDSIVTDDTDVVIEGFPRCANSYVVQAFQASQPHKIKIATHVHSPAHVLKAIVLKKPTIVLVRRPHDAILSWKALMLQYANGRKKNALLVKDPDYLIRYYIHFYATLLPVKDNFLIVPFEQVVIGEFDKIIESLNSKFSTNFSNIKLSSGEQKKIFGSAGSHLSPSKEREEIKSTIQYQFLTKKNRQLFEIATRTYQKFVLS